MTDQWCECDNCDCANAVAVDEPVCIQCRNGEHEDAKKWSQIATYVLENICAPTRETQADRQDQAKANDQ